MGTIPRMLLVGLACSAPLLAQAQTLDDNPWSRGTSMTGFGGVAIDSAQSGPLIGGSIGYDLTRRVAFEGSGTWSDYGGGADAFGAALKMRTNLAFFGRTSPFVSAGIGMYRASFEPNPQHVPRFYQRRMGDPRAIPARTFTDPSFVFGGGLNVSLTRTVKLRPDVEVTVVRRDARHHVVSGIRMHVVYVFEDHPVTPARR